MDLVHIQHATNFKTTINSWTLVAEKFILDVAGAADPPLCILRESIYKNSWKKNFCKIKKVCSQHSQQVR